MRVLFNKLSSSDNYVFFLFFFLHFLSRWKKKCISNIHYFFICIIILCFEWRRRVVFYDSKTFYCFLFWINNRVNPFKYQWSFNWTRKHFSVRKWNHKCIILESNKGQRNRKPSHALRKSHFHLWLKKKYQNLSTASNFFFSMSLKFIEKLLFCIKEM